MAEQLERRLALAVVTPFTVRWTGNDTGDITFAANTLMTAPAGPAGDAARNGTGTNLNNNDFVMTYVDIDTDVSTFNSSSAALEMPAGSQVLFAGLYWGARTNTTYPTGNTSLRDTVKFKAPGDPAYRNLTGQTIGTTNSSYQSFFDVTTIVQRAGAGSYTTANVQAIAEAKDYYAGWSLVVAYRAPDAPARNLTVFDGYGSVTSGDPAVTINISGFKAPTSGPVNATLGFITYEGDLSSTGDKVLFNGGLGQKQLSDPANPANNFFNSTISNRGSLVANKNPNYVNQLGYDADLITANGIIANGATSATIGLTTGGETFYPGVVTSAIDIFAPNITVQKSVQDLNGGSLVAGDTLRYTMVVANDAAALDTAVNVLLTDVIPANTTYKPGSLRVVAGPIVGTKTDAADGDQAQVVGNTVQFQLGTGAGGAGASGGSLARGESTTVTFEVTVVAPLPSATLIENVATVNYTGQTSGFNLVATDFANIATAEANLRVVKDDGKTQYVAGTTSTYTIVVTNDGPSAVTGARVVDSMPAAFTGVTWVAAYSAGSSGPLSGGGDIDASVNLLNGGTATFTVTAPVRVGSFGNITNTVFVINPPGIPDPNPADNTASDTNTELLPANLTLAKGVLDIDGGFVEAGDTLRYTIVVSNPANGGVVPNESAANILFQDLIPVGTTYAGGLTFTQGSLTGSASGVTGTLGSLAMDATATIVFDVTVNAGIDPSTSITNTAQVDATGGFSGLPLTSQDSVGVATPTAADLSVVKTTAPTFTPGAPGGVTYTIVVTNSGPTAVTGVTVLDTLPAGLSAAIWVATYTGAASSGPASGSGDINVTTVDLDVAGTATFVVTATADETLALGATLTNTARADNPSGVPDPNPSNNSSTTTTTAQPLTDLAIVKTDSQTTYVPGAPVTYTITVTNIGPSFATQASVIDTLDPALIASAAWTAIFTGSGSTGNAAGTGSLDEIIDLAAGGTAIYTVVVQTLSTGRTSLVNTATVTPSNLSNDPNPGNNESTDTNTVLLPASLTVVKTVEDLNAGFVLPGDILRYTIVVSNPSTVGSPTESVDTVSLTDILDGLLLYQSGTLLNTAGISPATLGESGGTITATWTTLTEGETSTITFEVQVDADTDPGTVIPNTASVTGVGDTSGLAYEDDDSVGVVTPPGADLTIVKSGPATYVPGQTLSYTIVVTNSGPTTSTNTAVVDTLPAGLTNATWTATYAGGASGAASGQGSINTTLSSLPQNGTATFTVTANVPAGLRTTLVNTATVDDPVLPDPNEDDNTSSVTSTAAPIADLQIVKTDGQTTYTPGQPLTYTITVTNAGPSSVVGARVQDAFPVLLVNASWTVRFTDGSGTTASGNTSIDQLVNLGLGGTAVYTVTASVSSTATGNLVNTATVTAPADTTDPNPANNTSTDTNTRTATAVVLGSAGGCDSTPLVRVLDATTGAVISQFLAYEPSFRGGVRVYGADVTGDGIAEIVTASGPGRPGEVRVWDRNGNELPAYRSLPYGAAFRGGVEVAVGDVTGDGKQDLVTGQSSGGNLVRAFTITPGAIDPVANSHVRQIQPFGAKYTGGVTVATADIGTFSGRVGVSEIIVGSGGGMRATIMAYNAVPTTPALISRVNPLPPGYSGGVFVSQLPGAPGFDKVLVTGGPGSRSQVETWAYNSITNRLTKEAAFAAYAGSAAGVTAAALDPSNIFSVQGTGGKTSGVKNNTSPLGGTSSTLKSSTSIPPPQRISVLRT